MKIIVTSSPEFREDLRALGRHLQEHGHALVGVSGARLVFFPDDVGGSRALRKHLDQHGGYYLGRFNGVRQLGRRVQDAIVELERRLGGQS